MDEDDYYLDQWDHEAAAEAGVTLDVYAPFTSIDACSLYRKYETHLDEAGKAGATEWHVMFWRNASRTLQRLEFHELFHRVELLKHTRWLEDLETKLIDEWLRKNDGARC